jgi:hypothetical protein
MLHVVKNYMVTTVADKPSNLFADRQVMKDREAAHMKSLGIAPVTEDRSVVVTSDPYTSQPAGIVAAGKPSQQITETLAKPHVESLVVPEPKAAKSPKKLAGKRTIEESAAAYERMLDTRKAAAKRKRENDAKELARLRDIARRHGEL